MSLVKCISFLASHQHPAVLPDRGLCRNENPFNSFLKSHDNVWLKTDTCSLLRRCSRCRVAACVLSKVVILLHVLHVGCGELGEVLRASVVHVIRRCKIKVLSFIFPLILHFRKNFCKPERQTVIIQEQTHKDRKLDGSFSGLVGTKAYSRPHLVLLERRPCHV